MPQCRLHTVGLTYGSVHFDVIPEAQARTPATPASPFQGVKGFVHKFRNASHGARGQHVQNALKFRFLSVTTERAGWAVGGRGTMQRVTEFMNEP